MIAIDRGSGLPDFSFKLDGACSSALLGSWERCESETACAGGRIKSVVFTDKQSNLQLTVMVRSFESVDAVDWVMEFANIGDANTPIISDVQVLDRAFELPDTEKLTLHHAKGSSCMMDDFLPKTDDIFPGTELVLAPVGGRSSNGQLPFVNLAGVGGGLVLAVGWTGQWEMKFSRKEGKLNICAGMDRTNLYLKPGEHIRTPRMLAINYSGSRADGNNILRSTILGQYTPRIDGELAIPPIAHMTMSSYHATRVVSPENELAALAKAASLGVEAYWVDACWYGAGNKWWEEVGNWDIRRDAFPDGLKPIGDAAHEAGMKFILWFEPERVRHKAPVAAEHPEYLLHSPLDKDNMLLNLGMPEARDYIVEAIDKIIVESGVDTYRQDFNMDPLPFWDAADTADRVGYTQAKHIEGLYVMWDELLARHPGLTIDNCSSGGRRIDLEMSMRSYPLWRSDFSDTGGPAFGMGLQIGDQCQTAGLSPWVPLHTAAVWSFSPYAFRSAMSSGVVIYCSILPEDFPVESAKAALAELKSLRPYYLGDFYPLITLTDNFEDWCAYQYHLSEKGAGFALFLRRHESPYESVQVKLEAIEEDALYNVSLSEDFKESPKQNMTGEELANLRIKIVQKPGSMLVRYQKI